MPEETLGDSGTSREVPDDGGQCLGVGNMVTLMILMGTRKSKRILFGEIGGSEVRDVLRPGDLV